MQPGCHPPNAIADMIEHQLACQGLDVPLLPEVTTRVISLTQSADSNAAELAALIQSDPTLAAHVMRTANSAAYSPNATLISLQQAITRLGMSLIADIAVAASISGKMFRTPGFTQRINAIWRHALATALWSKEIARRCRMNVEATFLCGLLHSIGRPVTIQAAIECADILDLKLQLEPMQHLEDSLQQKVGEAVLQRWGMPKIICEALHYFDDYASAPNAKDVTTIINAASHFARETLQPSADSLARLQQLEVVADLNLYADEVEELWQRHTNVQSGVEAMFRL